jgi:hypothetical protein
VATEDESARSIAGIDPTAREQALLVACSDLGVTRRRIRLVIVSGLFALSALGVAAFSGVSARALFAVTAVCVVGTTCEKVAYGGGVLLYKGLVNELHARVRELEGRVE